MKSIHGNRDPRIDVLESIIHRFEIVVSATALGSHSLMWASNDAILNAAEESYHLHVARLTGQLGVEIAVFKRMPLPGRPTVFVSLRAHPDADRALVLCELAAMRQFGTANYRGSLLEDPMPTAVEHLLPSGFLISPFPNHFHHDSRDMTITGPDGHIFDIELRNHSRNTHDRITPADLRALTANHHEGRTMILVTPRSTLRFRLAVAELSAETIDTGVYVVADAVLAQIATERGWACWPARTPEHCVPQIAQQIANRIIGRYPGMELEHGSSILGTAARLAAPAHGEPVDIAPPGASRVPSKHTQRVEAALRLYESGTSTQYGAAAILRLSAPDLSKAFKETGRVSPWRWGGPRSGGK